MQYPQIQFYRGSLVRLASGQLKHVEDLSSDDFVESARSLASSSLAKSSQQQQLNPSQATQSSNFLSRSTLSLANNSNNHNHHHQHHPLDRFQNHHHRNRFNFNPIVTGGCQQSYRHNDGSSGTLDENNNSVFNSPEPTSAGYDDSPRMDTDEYYEANKEEDTDVELDVVTNDDSRELHYADNKHQVGLNLSNQGMSNNLQHVNGLAQMSAQKQSLNMGNINISSQTMNFGDDQLNCDSGQFYIDSSVVRDFLEVGPIQQQQQQQQLRKQHQEQSQPPSSTSPASSTGSSTNHDQHFIYSLPSTSASSSSTSSLHQVSISPSIIMPQISSAATDADETVLIKFFLETSRSIAFIEVPIEHPFFVFHRGWSSWNPQKTYDKFGLKCRKLKIGDTCISLIRRRQKQAVNNPDRQHESDQCNILFSSIKINE